MVELAAHDEVDVVARLERRIGLHLDVRPDDRDLEIVLRVLHEADEAQIAGEAGR